MTSAILEDTPDNALDMVAVSAEAPGGPAPRGSRSARLEPGDLTAAVFLANLLSGHPLETVLARTTSSVFAVVDATTAAGEREMRLVQTQDLLAEPRTEFAPEKVG